MLYKLVVLPCCFYLWVTCAFQVSMSYTYWLAITYMKALKSITLDTIHVYCRVLPHVACTMHMNTSKVLTQCSELVRHSISTREYVMV